jgi:hypothetical protein
MGAGPGSGSRWCIGSRLFCHTVIALLFCHGDCVVLNAITVTKLDLGIAGNWQKERIDRCVSMHKCASPIEHAKHI